MSDLQMSRDITIIASLVLVLSLLRAGWMVGSGSSFAWFKCLQERSDGKRLAEQLWSLIIYLVLWPMGMVCSPLCCIMSNYDYLLYLEANTPPGQIVLCRRDGWKELQTVWTSWPTRRIDGLTKFHYLLQCAFRLQQIFVLGVEVRRKDFAQMLTHHHLTLVLVVTSYVYHFTKVGNLILCIMDVVDILLPVSSYL